MPGGVQIGIEYVAAPEFDTAKVVGVRPADIVDGIEAPATRALELVSMLLLARGRGGFGVATGATGTTTGSRSGG